MKTTNPGTITIAYYGPYSLGMVRFRHIFWAFGPSIAGFQYYWPLLSIDGTHLFGRYKYYLLIAMRMDADGGLYILSFVVVEGETKEIWYGSYHVSIMYQDKRITFISDRMKETPNALRAGCPSHRHHLRHIRVNFQKEFNDKSCIFYYRKLVVRWI